jgi:hypothetical protein
MGTYHYLSLWLDTGTVGGTIFDIWSEDVKNIRTHKDLE